MYVCSLYMRMFILCSCNIEARRAFVPLQPLQPFSSLQPFRSLLPRHALAFALLPFQHLCCRLCVPFAVPFALKRFQRSFYAVFRAVLSGLIVWRVHLHRLHRFVRLYSLILPYFAVCGGRGGTTPLNPSGARRN